MACMAIEVDSVWHDTERQQKNDGKKDRLLAAAGIPFMRLRLWVCHQKTLFAVRLPNTLMTLFGN
ncbi:DUF2726 domain-containing protein [Herbaspirillum sp. HC18]|nr:DUF2726 domain-containing protein [Herbaspirillum sp. HC18]